MYRLIIISLLILSTYNLSAQSIQRSVIGSAGKVLTGGAYKISATIGEVATKQFSIANGLSLHQGFQQNLVINMPLPIIGLDFYAQRLSSSLVQLQWQTHTEINNKGFYIERKLENDSDFNQQSFIASIANQGNSDAPLQYLYTDTNNFTGRTYYRIKQEDIDGKNSYSLIRIVNADASANLSLQIWPIPSSGYINVQLIGSNKTHEITVLDAQGKMIKNIFVENQQAYRIDDLMPGVYFICLKNDEHLTQKIMVQ